MNCSLKELSNAELEKDLAALERLYTTELSHNSPVHRLSEVWLRIMELKAELELREL